MKYLMLILAATSRLACAAPQEIDDYHWVGVERIVAIGDIHGDYGQYMATLQAAGLVNAKGKWIGGKTHLVQNGDIPDRGPDTAKIIRQLEKLSKEASKSGGMVHALMGNHEAMNVYGDLRYVTAGEYEAFVTRNSGKLRDRYFEAMLQDLQKRDPEKFAGLSPNFREEWNQSHPLGWVEHRQAWDPAWNPKGEFWEWVAGRKVAIQINDLIFLHGGISGYYCQNSLQSLTEKVVSGLRAYDPANPGFVEDEFGPLWYRGLSGEVPEAPVESVEAVLQ
ncbi:MAG: metallophosphoesterase, partial [Lysobacterales bacterium]